jgi:hypothetical protein
VSCTPCPVCVSQRCSALIGRITDRALPLRVSFLQILDRYTCETRSKHCGSNCMTTERRHGEDQCCQSSCPSDQWRIGGSSGLESTRGCSQRRRKRRPDLAEAHGTHRVPREARSSWPTTKPPYLAAEPTITAQRRALLAAAHPKSVRHYDHENGHKFQRASFTNLMKCSFFLEEYI